MLKIPPRFWRLWALLLLAFAVAMGPCGHALASLRFAVEETQELPAEWLDDELTESLQKASLSTRLAFCLRRRVRSDLQERSGDSRAEANRITGYTDDRSSLAAQHWDTAAPRRGPPA